VSGDVRENVRGNMSRYLPGMAHEKSGHPNVMSSRKINVSATIGCAALNTHVERHLGKLIATN